MVKRNEESERERNWRRGKEGKKEAHDEADFERGEVVPGNAAGGGGLDGDGGGGSGADVIAVQESSQSREQKPKPQI